MVVQIKYAAAAGMIFSSTNKFDMEKICVGFNDPPSDSDGNTSPFECRFYNAYFSILSSLVSFVIPCFVVVFVYMRIIIALKRRERAAKERKAISIRNNLANRFFFAKISEKCF